jgi:hypothetical protein
MLGIVLELEPQLAIEQQRELVQLAIEPVRHPAAWLRATQHGEI